jgi:glycine/D-amino acid oxidase-like deaminating enzyme
LAIAIDLYTTWLIEINVKIRSKEPYWLLKNGIINAYPSLRKNIECDILIVGGGITGALIAYQLSSEGHRTVMIDKRDIGTGSSSATTSMIQYELDEPLYSISESIGKESAVDIYIGAANAVETLKLLVKILPEKCGFATKQSLHYASGERDVAGLRKEFEFQKSAGFQVRWLTKDQILSGYGVVSNGGILSDTAASMDAYQMTHAVVQYCIKHFGLKVYDHTRLESVEYGTDENHAVVDTTAVIRCKKIVYTTGYETHELIRSGIGKLVSTYACISEPFDQLPNSLSQTVFWNTQDPYFYFRTTADNRILIGGEDENFKNAEKRDLLIEKKESDLVSKFQQQIPGIPFVADFSWAGTFGTTKDALPYIGEHPDFRNSYFLLGFGGNGITFSIMGMEILSDAIAGRPNRFLEYFKFKR